MQKLTEVLAENPQMTSEYSAFVWVAYAVAAVVILVMTLVSLQQWRRAKRSYHQLSGADEA